MQQIQLPNFWNLLSDVDKFNYHCLRTSMSAATCTKNQRNKRVENFTETLEAVKRFCVRRDGDDWKRCLVCGVCWLQEGIAINTRQLKILIFKCKSSINGSLHKMGFVANLGRSEAANALVMAIPFLKDNVNELRQWTVRQAGPMCASPISPPMPQNQVAVKNYEVPMISVVKQQQQLQQTAALPQVQRSKPLPIPCINFTKQKSNDFFELPNVYMTPEVPAVDEQILEPSIDTSSFGFNEEPYPIIDEPW